MASCVPRLGDSGRGDEAPSLATLRCSAWSFGLRPAQRRIIPWPNEARSFPYSGREALLTEHVAAAVRMPRSAHTTLPETPRMAWDHLARMNAAEARQQSQVFEALPSTSLHGLLLNGKIDGAPGHSAGLFSTAMRLYPENRVPLDMALKLLRLLDDVSMRSVWLGST